MTQRKPLLLSSPVLSRVQLGKRIQSPFKTTEDDNSKSQGADSYRPPERGSPCAVAIVDPPVDCLEDAHCDVLMAPKLMKALNCRGGDVVVLHCSGAEGRVPSNSSTASQDGTASVAAVVRQAPPTFQTIPAPSASSSDSPVLSQPLFLTSSLAHALGLRVAVLALSAPARGSEPASNNANGGMANGDASASTSSSPADASHTAPVFLSGVVIRVETLGPRSSLPHATVIRVSQVKEQGRELPVDAGSLKAFQNRYQQRGSALVLGSDKRGNMEERSIAALQFFFSRANRVLTTGAVVSLFVPRAANWPAPPADSAAALLSWASKYFVLLNFRIMGFESTGPSTALVPCSFRTDAESGVLLKTEGRTNSLVPSGAGALALSELLASVVASGAAPPAFNPAALPAPVLSFHTSALVSDAALLESATRRPLMPVWRSAARQAAAYFLSAERGDDVQTGLLLLGPHGSGRMTCMEGVSAALGIPLVPVNCMEVAGVADRQSPDMESAVAEALSKIVKDVERPSILVLLNLEALIIPDPRVHNKAVGLKIAKMLSDLAAGGTSRLPIGRAMLICAVASEASKIPRPVRRWFTNEIQVQTPDRPLREAFLASEMGGAASDDSKTLAAATAGATVQSLSTTLDLYSTVSEDLSVAAAQGEGTESAASLPPAPAQRVVELLKPREKKKLGAPEIPKTTWADVGGLVDAKRVIQETIELPLKHPWLFQSGMRPKAGILLYGPPGTGKTLLAKAIANECGLNFLSVKGPELINMYIGESERQVRQVFERARSARPCVLFFDELDSLAPARGSGQDSGGVMDRIVSQLLAEIDGLQDNADGSNIPDVFLVGATNRPDLLDSSLLRPGRLDTLVYVGIAADLDSRISVLRALTRKFEMDADIDLEAIAQVIPDRSTGADLYALCADAWMRALKRTAFSKNPAAASSSQPQAVHVTLADFQGALATFKPSISASELQRYLAIREKFSSKG